MIIKKTFIESLQLILEKAALSDHILVKEVFDLLSGKGYAALLIICSLPFCLPIQIPGFSTPFGIILSFLGIRIAFGKKLWWPDWVLQKKLSSHHVEKVVKGTIKVIKSMQKIIHPRLQIFTRNPLFFRLNGLIVFVLGIFLSLPLPIPMTNLLTAVPIFLIGLGLLEDDGLIILLAYLLILVSIGIVIGLFLFGKVLLSYALV